MCRQNLLWYGRWEMTTRAKIDLPKEMQDLALRLPGVIGQRAASAAIRTVLDRAADERLALAFLIELGTRSPTPLMRVLADPREASDLIFCLGASELVAANLSALGLRWVEVFRAARAQSFNSMLSSMQYTTPQGADRPALAQSLGQFKRSRFLQIVVADLLGHFNVEQTTAAMSRLADECIRAAVEIARRLLGERAGAVRSFCVLGMGKLGAEELNLSSDLDLVYLYESDDSAAEYAAKVGEMVTQLLAENCFRIDLRLRPGGQAGVLVPSMESALTFYENYGQTWERAAMLRGRAIGGDVALGRRLLAELGRFIYRKYLDFDTLRQLRQMKRQIEDELQSPDLVERNIKLGRGGIRELEFVVQALTLIYGGRDPRLRQPRTIAALQGLDLYGYLESGEARQLIAAYLFLRDVEHKLQAVAGLQTHTLPSDELRMRALAVRLGLGKGPKSVARLSSALASHRRLVAEVFKELLSGADSYSKAASSEAHEAWTAAVDTNRSAPILEKMGFARPDRSASNLLYLVQGPGHMIAGDRRRELLEVLGPQLLDEMCSLPDPDLALLNLSSFMAAVGARTSFLALLQSHPATRAILLRLFASSTYLSTVFVRHPDMLDTLVRSDLAQLRRSAVEMKQELSELIRASADFESRLDALRAFRHQEFLRIAIADLAGSIGLSEVQSELTQLAEIVLRQALEIARAEVSRSHSVPASMKLCAIGMGRLGSREMSYNSDLDLIFVYHDSKEAFAGSREAAPRIVQRVISVLEARTREGYAYKLDLRLRPSGNAGPLVTSMGGFTDYHRASSAVWERQALVRGRVVAGDAGLAAQVEDARQQFVFGKGLDHEGVAEIAAMRSRMEHEIGAEDSRRLNLKQGRGGLVDVEFLAQMMALRHGHAHRDLRLRGTVEMIGALGRRGLIETADADHLLENYRFLCQLENRLRIDSDQAAWAVPTDSALLVPLARRMGFDGDDCATRLLAELESRRSEIRAIYLKTFAGEQARKD
jgi:glutamate-ammonia-ligase adenylyltransferase